MLTNGEAGIDCINCGYQEIVTTQDGLEEMRKRLHWRQGDPVCPECNDTPTFEDYLEGE